VHADGLRLNARNRLKAVLPAALLDHRLYIARRSPTDRPGRLPLCLRLGMAKHGVGSDRIESGVQALNSLVQSEVIGKCVSFRDSQGYHYRY
jgi:hypothetical protein